MSEREIRNLMRALCAVGLLLAVHGAVLLSGAISEAFGDASLLAAERSAWGEIWPLLKVAGWILPAAIWCDKLRLARAR